MVNNKIIIMRYILFCFLLICCKDKSNNLNNEDSSYRSCNDTLYMFEKLSRNHYPTSYYDDKKLMNSLRYILNSNCDIKISTLAGTNIFFSYLIKNEMINKVEFKLDGLNKFEKEEALHSLKISSKGGCLEANYLLGILYLNGKYVKKDSLKGVDLLKKC
jgi:TPR repeat protein